MKNQRERVEKVGLSVRHIGDRKFEIVVTDDSDEYSYELNRHELEILDRNITAALGERALRAGNYADNRESFARLKNMEDRSLQYLISKTTNNDLALALLYAKDKKIEERFFKNLSEGKLCGKLWDVVSKQSFSINYAVEKAEGVVGLILCTKCVNVRY